MVMPTPRLPHDETTGKIWDHWTERFMSKQARRRARMVEARVCPQCGCRKPHGRNTLCLPCGVKKAEQRRKRRLQAKEAMGATTSLLRDVVGPQGPRKRPRVVSPLEIRCGCCGQLQQVWYAAVSRCPDCRGNLWAPLDPAPPFGVRQDLLRMTPGERVNRVVG